MIISNSCSSASHDEHGDFWIGSNFGLIHYNPVSQKQTHIPTNLFTEVNMVQCDQRGKVWIGADNLLFAWLIQEQKFVLFGESNGAIQNEYLPNARFSSGSSSEAIVISVSCGLCFKALISRLLRIISHLSLSKLTFSIRGSS